MGCNQMKFLQQAVIIAAITFAAEIIKYLVPLPVPASIYGLILLFTLLKSGLLKLGQIEDVGGLLLELMPLLLAPASVSVLADLETVRTMLAPLLLAGFVGTSVVMLITGQVVQRIVRRGGGRSEK